MANQIPEDLKYTKDHEWAKLDGDIVSIGITDFAQSQLGEIVFVELPEVGSELDAEATFGVVESIKSVSDLFSPITGTVSEINDSLESSPEALNSSPYDSWMIKLKVNNTDEFSKLLDHEDYQKLCQESE